MCVPQGASRKVDSGYIEIKPKKHIKKVFKKEYENGDPDFVDERVKKEDDSKKEKSFLESLLE
ncbi:MAG: hypothetical protein PHU40_07920 [Sulfurimonas sp.]|nr:hypothetical protein [Sulfurimonas sp.]